jgi:PAS domain S-box-containing protein
VSTKELVLKAVESAQDAIFLEEPEGKILLWNAGAERLYGFQTEEVAGRVLDSLGTASIREECLRSGDEQSKQITQSRKDGSQIQVWLRSAAVRDDEGRLLAFSHMGCEAPQGSTLWGFLESAPYAVLVVGGDGVLDRANGAAVALFGHSREQLRGMGFETLIPERYHPPDSNFCRLGNVFAIHRDGREIPVEVAYQPLNNLPGRPVLVSVVDISQHIAAEQRFKLAVEAAPCGMLMIDPTGRITLVNRQAQELFGYTHTELLGGFVGDLVPGRYRAGHARLREQYFVAPTARRMGAGRELFGVRKDGTEVPVEIGLNPITTAEGEFVLASIIDSTERRRATEELQASLRDKELLLQEIHHRVKNNLAMIGSILYLQSSITDDGELLRVLQECQERVRSMSLVHERLYLTGDLGRLDLSDYVHELTEQLARNNALNEQRVSLAFDLERIPLNLKQAVPCGLILNELLTNAFKHAFQGRNEGAVHIVLGRENDGRITLAVQDDGRGRAGDSFGREGSLGLRLVRSLTRQLDGEFELQHPPGGGTRARLCFEEVEQHE